MRNALYTLTAGLIALLLAPPARAQDGATVDTTGMGIYAMEDAVNRQVTQALTRNQNFTSAGDARKQEMARFLLI